MFRVETHFATATETKRTTGETVKKTRTGELDVQLTVALAYRSKLPGLNNTVYCRCLSGGKRLSQTDGSCAYIPMASKQIVLNRLPAVMPTFGGLGLAVSDGLL